MARIGRGRGVGARLLVALALALGLLASPLAAQDLGARARISGALTVVEGWRDLTLTLPLSQPVPWRTRLLTDPPRAVIDFRTVDWSGFDPATVPPAGGLAGVRVGEAGGGWSRMVLDLSRPMGFVEAGMSTDALTGAARLDLRLAPLSDAEFAAQAAALAATDGPGDTEAPDTGRLPLGNRPTVLVLDPGHGGVDPGAVHEGLTEAEVILTFARELADLLRRSGRYEVVMTRDSDSFVSLEGRITVAHSTQADLFLSLHADALDDGEATGATLYTLAAEATDAASAALAERHDRDDMLGGGVDLRGTDDAVAGVLMQLARQDTGPATDRLARDLVAAIRDADLRMHRHPWQQAAFSVLKSPSVPSALLEIGFLSSARDRTRLRDPRWRARMAQAILTGLDTWVQDEAAQHPLRLR